MTLTQRTSYHPYFCKQQFIVTTSLIILLCAQLTQGKGPPGTPSTTIPPPHPSTRGSPTISHETSTSFTEVILADAAAPLSARAALSGVALSSSSSQETSTSLAEIILADAAVPLSAKVPSASLSSGPGREQPDLTLYKPACHNFTEGSADGMQFYSPNYPNNYPNNTDCIKILTAEPGHLLRLDFRGTFNIEPSEDCRYDYLEVRDGGHAHSNIIGRYCGHSHPDMVTSLDRQLWLRFHSDENIEYQGFHAIYQNIPRPTSSPEAKVCEMMVGGVEGWVNISDVPEERLRHSHTYSVPLDCMWVIRVMKGWKIYLTFQKFSLATPNDCDSNFVDVFYSKTDIQQRSKNFWKFCGSIADSVSSNGTVLYVRMYADARSINKTVVEALFTAFREKQGDGCAADELDCEDNNCISKTLRCNQRNNCRYQWDEHGCLNTKVSFLNKDHIIAILVVFTLILSGMCFAFIFNCMRKLIKDHHIMKEHVRQSREGRLDELGRGSAGMNGEGITTLGNAVSLGAIPGGSSSGSSPRNLKLRAAVAAMTRYSSEPPRTPLDEDDPARGCYVPAAAGDGALPPGLLEKPRYNGDAIIFRENSPSIEMRDSECQTRDSLFNQDSSIPPPPPAPRYAQPPRVPPTTGNNPRFSTFGRSASTAPLKELNKPEEIEPPHRFRAEAVIEMQQQAQQAAARQQQQQQQQQQGGGGGGGRPYSSAESTKSAPDVIVTH